MYWTNRQDQFQELMKKSAEKFAAENGCELIENDQLGFLLKTQNGYYHLPAFRDELTDMRTGAMLYNNRLSLEVCFYKFLTAEADKVAYKAEAKRIYGNMLSLNASVVGKSGMESEIQKLADFDSYDVNEFFLQDGKSLYRLNYKGV